MMTFGLDAGQQDEARTGVEPGSGPAAQERELRAAGVVRCSSTMASRVGYGTGRSESLAWTTCGLVTPLWCGLWIGSPARRRWRSRPSPSCLTAV